MPGASHYKRSLLILAALCPSSVLAQQQVPSQHSPSEYRYTQPNAGPKVEPVTKSKVTLGWPVVRAATHYVLKISREPNAAKAIFTLDTVQTTTVTPLFDPGQYYYQVEAFKGSESIQTTPFQRFLVGKPIAVEVKAQPKPLAAPTILTPKNMEMFPSHGKVRLSWQTISGARGYLFRLWDEDKIKEDSRNKKKQQTEPQPRWITEIAQPWIVVRDAPYSSFMYLDSGLYRWDVAAVDKNGGLVGEPSSSYFTVSKDWFLKSSEVFLRFQYALTPQLSYTQRSITLDSSSTTTSASHKIAADMDWFFMRELGANLGLAYQIIPTGGTLGNTRALHVNADMLYRKYLSNIPWGWTMVLSGGIGGITYPQEGSSLMGLGPRVGFRFLRRWHSPWEMQLLGGTQYNLLPRSGPTTNTTLRPSFNGDAEIRFLYHSSPRFAESIGLGGELRRVSYVPKPFSDAVASVAYSGWNIAFMIQWNFFSEEPKSTAQSFE